MFRDSVNSTITNVAFADSMAVAGLVDPFLFLLFPPVVCTLHNARCENLINFPVTSISRKNYFANIRGSKAVLFKFLYLFKKKTRIGNTSAPSHIVSERNLTMENILKNFLGKSSLLEVD